MQVAEPTLPGSRRRAMAKRSSSGSAGAQVAKKRKVSVAQTVRGKLRECAAFRGLSATEKRLIVDPATGLTLEKRLIRDVQNADAKGEKLHFGADQNRALAAVYRRGDSVFQKLKPPADCTEEPDAGLRKVLQMT